MDEEQTFAFTLMVRGVTREQAEELADDIERVLMDRQNHQGWAGYTVGPDASTTVVEV